MDKGSAFDHRLLLRLLQYIKPYKKVFYVTIALTLLLSVTTPLRPYLSQVAIDNYVKSNDKHGLLNITLIMTLVLVLQAVFQYWFTALTNLLGQNVIRDMRKKLFAHLMQLNLKYFDKTPLGVPVTRIINDMETIADIFTDGLLVIIGDLLQMAGMLAFMFYIDWRLAFISISTIPLLLVATNIFKNKIKVTFNDVRTAVTKLNSFVQEHLTGMRIVQIFNREEEEFNKFKTLNYEHRTANIKSVWYYSIFFPVVEILSAIAIGLLVWWGAGAVIKEQASFGQLVAFIMYINILFRPIRELADKFNTLQMGMVAGERIFALLDNTSITRSNGNYKPAVIKGHIEFRNVWFAYDDENWVLKDISFEVQPGKMCAIVGETGSGKTSIINLLNRFYDANKGTILIDGADIKTYDIEALRHFTGLVQQDVFLFSGTVSDNISLFDSNITDNHIIHASEIIGAHEFIERLPGQYGFNVQERGNMLSTGQRQLIAFARAYASKPSILILDEATSSVDQDSELKITHATEKLTSVCTSIVIAHRLSTIQKADNILVLDKGEIAEQGNHTTLLGRNGLYKELFEIQFKLTGQALV